jgi:photosystem II stability/assembly factor-like uncharacterized protein
MATHLYIATAMGLFIATQTDGNWNLIRHALQDKSLTSVTVSDGIILAGSAEGVWRSTDGGQSWNAANDHLSIRHIRWMTHFSSPQSIFLVGTEPAGIFVSHDGAKTWNGSSEVGRLRDANGWFLPYSPKAGCVRGFAAVQAENHDGRIYAAVEVGGVLISDDGGNTWRLAEGSDGSPEMNRELGKMVHPDVHSITVQPGSPDLVTAATGGGLYRSTDGGRSWENIYPCYIRAIWVDPADHRHMIAGPADGVSRNGRIEESRDGGKTWQPASAGMAPTPWSKHMVERFFQFDNELLAVLSNGELWSRGIGAFEWKRLLPEIHQIKAVAVAK